MKTKEVIDLREKVVDVAVRGRPLTPKSKLKFKEEGIRIKNIEE